MLVAADRDGTIRRLYWIQFERLLPGVGQDYDYSADATVTVDGVSFRFAEGTLNVLLAARDEDVRRVVFASSSSVYGNSGTLPRREDAAPDPISPYAVAKLAAERYCVSFGRVYESFEAVVLRYFTVYGPRQRPDMAFHKFLSATLRGAERLRFSRTVSEDFSASWWPR